MISLHDNDNANQRQSIASDMLPDLTPLIDVMFLLIIFLLLTANAVPLAIDVDLPSDEHQTSHAITDPHIISLELSKVRNAYTLNKKAFTSKEAFEHALLKQINISPEARIVIASDKAAEVEKLLDTLSFLRKHGANVADIVMK